MMLISTVIKTRQSHALFSTMPLLIIYIMHVNDQPVGLVNASVMRPISSCIQTHLIMDIRVCDLGGLMSGGFACLTITSPGQPGLMYFGHILDVHYGLACLIQTQHDDIFL